MLIISIDERNGAYLLTTGTMNRGLMDWYALNLAVSKILSDWRDEENIAAQNLEASQSVLTEFELKHFREEKRYKPASWFWRAFDRREKQRFAEGL